MLDLAQKEREASPPLINVTLHELGLLAGRRLEECLPDQRPLTGGPGKPTKTGALGELCEHLDRNRLLAEHPLAVVGGVGNRLTKGIGERIGATIRVENVDRGHGFRGEQSPLRHDEPEIDQGRSVIEAVATEVALDRFTASDRRVRVLASHRRAGP